MDEVIEVMGEVLGLFKMEFNLFGYTFSFWNIMLLSMAAGIAAWVIRRFYDN